MVCLGVMCGLSLLSVVIVVTVCLEMSTVMLYLTCTQSVELASFVFNWSSKANVSMDVYGHHFSISLWVCLSNYNNHVIFF